MGFAVKHYAEKKRIRWAKQDVEFDIDIYPELEPYIEIETTSWEKIESEAKLIGLNYEDKKIFSANQVYAMKGIDVGKLLKISFTDGLVERKD
jgi:adenylate cyclase class IV